MEVSILKAVGQVAGIGGVALGVLLLIFRDVVRKNIFPNLSQIQAYRIIRLVVVLTFLVATSGIAGWVYIQSSAAATDDWNPVFPAENPELAIRKYLELVDAERIGDAWNSMSKEGQKRFPLDLLKQAYEGARQPLGSPTRRVLSGVNTLRQLPDQTRGAFAVAVFVTRFKRGSGQYQEMVTVIAENGVWKVLFHQLAPCQPGPCQPD